MVWYADHPLASERNFTEIDIRKEYLTLPKCLQNFGPPSSDCFGDINGVPNFYNGVLRPLHAP